MAKETSSHDLDSAALLPTIAKEPAPAEAGAATAQAMRIAPSAIRRSMPMALSVGLGILIAVLIGWLFHQLFWFILILYLCFIAATVLEAPTQWLKRHGIRRGLAAVLVMVVSAAIVGSSLYFLTSGVYTQLNSVSTKLEKAPERFNALVNGIKRHFVHKPQDSTAQNQPPLLLKPAPPASPVEFATTAPTATSPATSAPATSPIAKDFDLTEEIAQNFPSMSTLWSNAMSGMEGVSWLVIMFFIVLYMLVDGADHLKAFRRLLPKRSRLEVTKLFNEIAKAHRGWAFASFSNIVSASLLTGTGLYLVGVPAAFILGLVAGFGELIPNIGPFLGAMPALALTLLVDPDKFVYVVGMFVIVQTIQGYTISPMMLKFSIELPILVTIISVLTFGILFGLLGILVAIPLVADLVVLWQYANHYLEKDTEDYDMVNSQVDGARTPMSPDNTSPSGLRKIFRRRDQRNPSDPPSGGGASPKGLDSLEKTENRLADARGSNSP